MATAFPLEDIEAQFRPADAGESARVAGALRALARPRLTGSAGAAEVEAELARRFRALGYQLRDLPFTFSTWPGRYAVPAAGGVLLLATAGAALLLLSGRAAAALVALLGSAFLLLALALGARAGIARLRWGRVRSANWLVHRPGVRPRYLVAAHRDSKSQPLSTLLRLGACGAAAAAWTALVCLALIQILEPEAPTADPVRAAGAVGVAAGFLLLCCAAGNRSPGALDNASGLAALLGVAERERERDDVAFLITDGEELGLAGARALGRQLAPVFGVINLDGLDDGGGFHIVERFGWPRRGEAPHLSTALVSAARALGHRAERRDLPLGMLVDHMAFTEAGLPAVTLMRGRIRSLLRVHRPADRADRLTGIGAAAAVAVVAGALELLRRASGTSS